MFGITFQQGRNEFKIDADLLNNLVTENQRPAGLCGAGSGAVYGSQETRFNLSNT